MNKQKESRIHKRGFASLSEARRREVAAMGGKAAQATGRAYRWDSTSAKDAVNIRIQKHSQQ